jgi:hypothetical protein
LDRHLSEIPISQLSLVTRGAFAQTLSMVQIILAINEMYICAVFSALYGWCNEKQEKQ